MLILFPCLCSTCLPDIWWDTGQGGQDQAKHEAFVGYLKLLSTALGMDALAAEAVVGVRETSYPLGRISSSNQKAREDGDDKRVVKAGRMEVQPSAQDFDRIDAGIIRTPGKPSGFLFVDDRQKALPGKHRLI